MKPSKNIATLALQNVTKNFGTNEVVRNLSLNCPPNTRLSILGPSGCGKSTLLKLIVGLEKPDNGSIKISNRPIDCDDIVRRVAYLDQRPTLLPWLSARDNALLPLRLARALTPDDHRHADELFDMFELKGARHLRPGELSGGMRQRVALVQTLILGADILIFDEPFAALDDVMRRSVICQLHGWIARHELMLIMVTHSFEDAAYLSDRVLFWRHTRRAHEHPQLYESTATTTFCPAGNLSDFSIPEFTERKSRLFSEYLTQITNE